MQFGLPLLYSATYVRHDVALPAFARRIPQQQQPINISCPPAGLTAANLQQRICCCGPMLGQIDGRTPYRYIDPAANSTRAVAVRITAKSLLIPDRPLQDVALAHSASLPPSRVFGLDNWLLSIHLPPYSASSSHVSLTCRTDAGSGPPPLNSLTFRPVVGQLSDVVPFLLLQQRCGMACQAMLRRPRRCRCSRTG